MTSSSRSRTFASRLRGHRSFNMVVIVLDSRRHDVIATSTPPPPPSFRFRFDEPCVGRLTRTSVASQSQMSFRIYAVRHYTPQYKQTIFFSLPQSLSLLSGADPENCFGREGHIRLESPKTTKREAEGAEEEISGH